MRILLCIAGMPYAEATISFGCLIARFIQAVVTLLHVMPCEEGRGSGERTLVLAREMLVGLSVDTKLRQGNPIENILAEAREGGHGLIVIGARHKVGLAQRFLGSVAQTVVRRAPVSVLVVRQPGPDLHRILICTIRLTSHSI